MRVKRFFMILIVAAFLQSSVSTAHAASEWVWLAEPADFPAR